MLKKKGEYLFNGLLFIMDGIVAMISLLAAYMIRHDTALFTLKTIADNPGFQPYLHLLIFAPFVRFFSYQAFGIYEKRQRFSRLDDTFNLLKAISLGTFIIITITFLYRGVFRYRGFSYARLVFLYDWLLNLCLVNGLHQVMRSIREGLRKGGIDRRRVAIQGADRTGKILATEILRSPALGYELVGFIDDERQSSSVSIGNHNVRVIGTSKDILSLINRHRIDEIFIAHPQSLKKQLLDLIEECSQIDVATRIVPDLFGILTYQARIDNLAGIPLLEVKETTLKGWNWVMKEVEDFVLASLGLILLFPFALIIALLIKLDSPGPVFFRQERVGKNGRTFTLYKFRSMVKDAEKLLEEVKTQNESTGMRFKIKGDSRITRIGHFLRRTSLDELPQLLNVIKGNMSLVGPRPPLPSEVKRYKTYQRKRFTTTPGMTGLWQVNRSDLSFEEMVKWDIYYIENWSLWLDFKILLKTIPVVLVGRGAY